MMNRKKNGKSYAHGGAGPPLLGITVSGVLDEAAANWPDRDALVVADQGVRWSWSELRERARVLAKIAPNGYSPNSAAPMQGSFLSTSIPPTSKPNLSTH